MPCYAEPRRSGPTYRETKNSEDLARTLPRLAARGAVKERRCEDMRRQLFTQEADRQQTTGTPTLM